MSLVHVGSWWVQIRRPKHSSKAAEIQRNPTGSTVAAVQPAADVPAALERLMDIDGPALLHVVLENETNVWPFVPPGQSNSVMMEGT